jgi:hypothetical protein
MDADPTHAYIVKQPHGQFPYIVKGRIVRSTNCFYFIKVDKGDFWGIRDKSTGEIVERVKRIKSHTTWKAARDMAVHIAAVHLESAHKNLQHKKEVAAQIAAIPEEEPVDAVQI